MEDSVWRGKTEEFQVDSTMKDSGDGKISVTLNKNCSSMKRNSVLKKICDFLKMDGRSNSLIIENNRLDEFPDVTKSKGHAVTVGDEVFFFLCVCPPSCSWGAAAGMLSMCGT